MDKPQHPTALFDDEAYDFIDRFPAPQDARLHEAGRQGLLEQKESAELSDAQWVAILHSAWSAEMAILAAEIARLEQCLRRGIDPASGRAPRLASRRQRHDDEMRERLRLLQRRHAGALRDYADHFGEPAARAFAAFVAAQARSVQRSGEQAVLFD